MTNEHAQMLDRVQKIATELGEYADSVRIFVTLPTENGTSVGIDAGCGNLYAQIGQVSEWLCIQTQYQRNWAIRKDNEDEGT